MTSVGLKLASCYSGLNRNRRRPAPALMYLQCNAMVDQGWESLGRGVFRNPTSDSLHTSFAYFGPAPCNPGYLLSESPGSATAMALWCVPDKMVSYFAFTTCYI